ncbi:MAG TPA: hypothetical protein VJ991_07315 [Balneolales bacterium]|nr:hypothetical protein [Balneolales bacterium]
MDAKSKTALTQNVVVDGYFTNWALDGYGLHLKAINDHYFAIGIFYDVVLVNADEFKPVKEIIYKHAGEKNNFLLPWYRVWNSNTRISYHGLNSDSLLEHSTLQALQFKDLLHPSFQTILNLNAQRTDSTHYLIHDIMDVYPYQDSLEVLAKSTIYDLLTDSLNTRLYTNPYYESVSFYTGNSKQNFSIKTDFHPNLPYHTIDYQHVQGLLGDHYAFLSSYSHSLYVQDLSTHILRKVHNNVYRDGYAIDGHQVIFATSNKIFKYDPSTNKTEELISMEGPIGEYDLSMYFDVASNQLFVSYETNYGNLVRCIRIDLTDKSVTDLYSKQLTGSNMYPLISNFIQINGQFYTTISTQDPQ